MSSPRHRPLPALHLPALLVSALALWPHPAAAGHDEEIALSSVLARAHDRTDISGLLRMMTADERDRATHAGLEGQFERHLFALGVTQGVACAQMDARPGDPYLPALDEYRCGVLCRLGEYTVRVTMSPPDPKVVLPTPLPGHIERLFLASPLLDDTPFCWPFSLASAGRFLFGLLLLVLLAAHRGLRWAFPFAFRLTFDPGALWPLRPARAALYRLFDRFWYQGFPRKAPAPSLDLHRALYHGVFLLRLCGALAVIGLFLPLFACFGPAPRWGHAAMRLGEGFFLFLGLGHFLSALADFHRPGRRPLWLPAIASVVLILSGLFLLSHSVLDEDALSGVLPHLRPRRQLGTYELPLAPAGVPAYVRRGDGPVLDLVLQHDDGRSCHGPAPTSCRGFGAQVVAPADGMVVEAADGHADQDLGQRDREHPTGNHLVLKTGPAGRNGQTGQEFILLSHLMRGSVEVRPGQKVHAGQPLARLGNSGDSDEPHLSFSILPAPTPLPPAVPALPCGAAFDEESTRSPRIFLSRFRVHSLLGPRDIQDAPPLPGQRISSSRPPGLPR